MPERGTKYRGSTPSNPLFGGPQGRAMSAPKRNGNGPHYAESNEGLADQVGGFMAEPASGAQGLNVQFPPPTRGKAVVDVNADENGTARKGGRQ